MRVCYIDSGRGDCDRRVPLHWHEWDTSMDGTGSADKFFTVFPDGNIVADKVPALKVELLAITQTAGAQVTIDLSKVGIIDSTGIGIFIAVFNTLKKSKGSLRLINVSPDIYKMLAIMRLSRHFEITPKAS